MFKVINIEKFDINSFIQKLSQRRKSSLLYFLFCCCCSLFLLHFFLIVCFCFIVLGFLREGMMVMR